MPAPSTLDLTGRASEDEPASSAFHHQQQQQPPLSTSRRSNQRLTHQEPTPQQAEQPDGTPSENDGHLAENLSNGTSQNGGVLTYLPSPIDLWRSRTPTSLLLLPIVVMIYIILQLPLHYNSTTENAEMLWMGRAKAVEDMSNDFNRVERELETVKDDQVEIKGMVTSLRRRLGKMKERRAAREELLRRRQELRERMEKEEELRKHHKQGLAKDGPIMKVSMVKVLPVATFVGKVNNLDDAKKDD